MQGCKPQTGCWHTPFCEWRGASGEKRVLQQGEGVNSELVTGVHRRSVEAGQDARGGQDVPAPRDKTHQKNMPPGASQGPGLGTLPAGS